MAGEGDDFEVYFDSGVRSGRDVLKALCLGAKGVGLGRPQLGGSLKAMEIPWNWWKIADFPSIFLDFHRFSMDFPPLPPFF